MVALAKVPVRMSVQEFLAWDPGGEHTWQLVDGAPEAMVPANRTHGTLQGEMGNLIINHLRDRGSTCALVVRPGVVPHMHASHNMRVPDLAVTCSDYEVEETGITDPVLIVEVLSPSNQAETWANVWTYATIPSVREIVVLRTASIGAEVLRRHADNTWPQEPESLTDGVLVLESIGLRVSLIDLYRSTRLRRPPA